MKILITGGTGTISSGIAQEALNSGYEVYVMNRGNNKSRVLSGVNTIICNVWDRQDVASKLENLTFDVIVECLVYDVKHLKISLENFQHKCSQYIFISTADVYKRDNTTINITEDYPCTNNGWDYPKNKTECEQYLSEYAISHNLIYTIVRPPVVYSNYRIPYPIVSKKNQWMLFERIKKQKPIIAGEDDETIFTLVHISDFSRYVISLFKNNDAFQEAFHIGNEHCYYHWDEVIKYACNILSKPVKIIHVPMSVYKELWKDIYPELNYNKYLSLMLNDKKIRKLCNDYKPETQLESALEKSIEYLSNNSDMEFDTEWDCMCDYIIYYSVKHNLLNSDELHLAKDYLSSMDNHEIKNIVWTAKKYQIKNKLNRNRYINKLVRGMKKMLKG